MISVVSSSFTPQTLQFFRTHNLFQYDLLPNLLNLGPPPTQLQQPRCPPFGVLLDDKPWLDYNFCVFLSFIITFLFPHWEAGREL